MLRSLCDVLSAGIEVLRTSIATDARTSRFELRTQGEERNRLQRGIARGGEFTGFNRSRKSQFGPQPVVGRRPPKRPVVLRLRARS